MKPAPLNSTSARATLLALTACSVAACGGTTPTLPAPPAYSVLLRNPLAPVRAGSVPVVSVGGRPAVWIARTGSGVTLLHTQVPAPGRTIASVRQNLALLVDNGRPASTVTCDSCWGATLGGVADPARAALGITAGGRLVWAGGENLGVSELANAMTGAGVVRAVELDINPDWVAAYLYSHRNGAAPPIPHQAMPGQAGIQGQFLQPYSRDFFTVHAR